MELPKLSRLFTNEKSAQLSSMPVLKLERLFSSSVYKKEVDFEEIFDLIFERAYYFFSPKQNFVDEKIE